MKNMIKMSLVAAVAVAGLSSTVAAKPLEEAIKNVDVSGSVLFRYNDYNDDVVGKAGATNYYKIATSIKSKVNDNVTATVRVIAGNGTNLVGLGTSTAADTEPTFVASHANFTVKTDVATVIAGKQALATPWTIAIDNDGHEQTGTGLLSLIPAGSVTIAAAAFNQTNLDGSTLGTVTTTGAEDVMTLGVLGKAGPVSFDAWYLDMQDVLDSYTLSAKAKIDMVTVDARYTSLSTDTSEADGTTENSLLLAKVSAKFGAISTWAQYGMTDKDGGTTALENSAKTSLEGWGVTTNGKADADYFGIGAGMDVMSGLNLALNFRTIDYAPTANTEGESTELYTQITHKMGKNLVTYVRLGTNKLKENNVDKNDSFRGRLQVEYKF